MICCRYRIIYLFQFLNQCLKCENGLCLNHYNKIINNYNSTNRQNPYDDISTKTTIERVRK